MNEEMRNNPSAIFFTGTFTDKKIEQLSRKYGIDKKNVNEIATKEVRLFLERIRQTKYFNFCRVEKFKGLLSS